MASESPKIVFGTASIGNRDPFIQPADVEAIYSTLLKHGVTNLDTAQIYGESEAALGASKAGERFTIDTKWSAGFVPGSANRAQIVSSAQESIKKLGVKQVDIFYLHAPDANTPDEDTLAGVQEVYQLGLFKRFGLSNYPAERVEKVYNIAKEQGYVLPTVYQGNYSPVARKQETLLFPLLRKLNISFYAYSPLAGGFLTKTAQQIAEGAGRFNDEALGGMYKSMYAKPAYIKALEQWEALAKQENVSRAELAYRWVAYHSGLTKSLGDAIIVGASSNQQLEQTLVGIAKGKLSDEVVKGIDLVWEEIKHEAPLDNYHR